MDDRCLGVKYVVAVLSQERIASGFGIGCDNSTPCSAWGCDFLGQLGGLSLGLYTCLPGVAMLQPV